MRVEQSHGRLDFKLAFCIFGSLSIAFGLGLSLGIHAMQVPKENQGIARIQEANTHSRFMTESFWNSIDSLRTQALGLKQVRDAYAAGNSARLASAPGPTGNILFWVEFEVKGEQLQGVRQSARNPDFSPGWILRDEEFYLRSIAQRMNMRELKENGVAIVRVQRDPSSPSEWLALGFGGNEGVLVALVDPVQAFPAFHRMAGRSESNRLRSYLIAPDGRVLAHSQPTYVSADFRSTPLFKGALNSLMKGARTNGAGTFSAVDKLKVVAAYTRPGTLPIGIVVEKLIGDDTLGTRAIWQRAVGQGLGSLGVLVVIGLAWIFAGLKFRRTVLQQKAKVEAQPAPVLPAVVQTAASVGVPSPQSFALELQQVAAQKAEARVQEQALRKELLASQSVLQRVQEEGKIVAEFERDAAHLKDPRVVARRLADTTTRLCSSPTMFFSFHEGLRSAVLHADSGFGAGESPVGMSFPIDNAILERVVQCERRGEIASLSDYPPLTKLLMARTGIAHFEAWAVTGFGHLGRIAGKPKLLGVLVILQAGVDSATRHEALSRMMRTTGLVYENAILAQ